MSCKNFGSKKTKCKISYIKLHKHQNTSTAFYPLKNSDKRAKALLSLFFAIESPQTCICKFGGLSKIKPFRKM